MRLSLKITKRMYKAIKKQARTHKRSVKGEIISILSREMPIVIKVKELPDDVLQEVLIQGLKKVRDREKEQDNETDSQGQ